MSDKCDKAITCDFSSDLHLTLHKKSHVKEVEVWQNSYKTLVLLHLSHKVCHILSSAVLLRKFTNEQN